jgi:DNA modification methylase
MRTARILVGDVRERLRDLPDGSVQCCVTSPPYWGLRDYGVDGQLGLERTPHDYVTAMVGVFREVWRVLRDDGTCWINLGDSYNAYNGGAGPSSSLSRGAQTTERPQLDSGYGLKFKGLKPKDLVGIPWRVAFALQADGWYLRSDIIWYKPNPMPESVTDRPTKAHEYIFLLTKSQSYYYDAEAIAEIALQPTGPKQWTGSQRKAVIAGNHSGTLGTNQGDPTRNARSVWTITTQPYPEAHFATFPEELPTRCIKAGSRQGDTVLDPFNGSGTTGAVAVRLGRNYIGCELNPAYVELARKRIGGAAPLFAQEVA